MAAAVTVLCLACSAPTDGRAPTAGSDLGTAPASHSLTGTTPGQPNATAATTHATPSEPTTSTTSRTTDSPAMPGGSGDTAALATAGDLTADGLVALHVDSRGAGTVGTAQTDSGALCQYLFGTPLEIAEITRLPADLSLDPISGRHTAADSGTESDPAADAQPTEAAVIACVYSTGLGRVLVLQVGDGPPIDPDLPGKPIIVDSGTLQAVVSYSPEHVGPTVEAATARAWLTATLGRVSPMVGTTAGATASAPG